MLEYTELDNRITKTQLNKTFPNKVNIQYGLDANKIKGVSNFPIYDATDGFNSHAKSNLDSFMFHSTHKYDVAKPTHTSVGEIQPYLYDKKNPSHPRDTNVRIREGELSSLYGLPPDKTIVLENPTAQAMNLMGGKMTETKMRNHIWREHEKPLLDTDFMSDPRMQKIIGGDDSDESDFDGFDFTSTPKSSFDSIERPPDAKLEGLDPPQKTKAVGKFGLKKTSVNQLEGMVKHAFDVIPSTKKRLYAGSSSEIESVSLASSSTSSSSSGKGAKITPLRKEIRSKREVRGRREAKGREVIDFTSVKRKLDNLEEEKRETELQETKEDLPTNPSGIKLEITAIIKNLEKDPDGIDAVAQKKIRALMKKIDIKPPHGNLKLNNKRFGDEIDSILYHGYK